MCPLFLWHEHFNIVMYSTIHNFRSTCMHLHTFNMAMYSTVHNSCEKEQENQQIQ